MLQFTKSQPVFVRARTPQTLYGIKHSLELSRVHKKFMSVVGGFLLNFMIGGYVALGNMVPYLSSYLTAHQFDFAATNCSADIQTSYAKKLSVQTARHL